MPVSLHAAFIPSAIRILTSCQGWLDKAEAFAADKGISEDTMMNARLFEDMLPFNYQVKSMCVHSQGAIEGLRNGSFQPDFSEPPASFAALRERVASTIAFLQSVSEDEMEGLIGKEMFFEVPRAGIKHEFTADSFLNSFSQSNFYFHSVTAYDILRMQGVELGKRDYMGALPMIKAH